MPLHQKTFAQLNSIAEEGWETTIVLENTGALVCSKELEHKHTIVTSILSILSILVLVSIIVTRTLVYSHVQYRSTSTREH